MALHHYPRIVTDGLVLYLDVNNSRCCPHTGTVTTKDKLYNLVTPEDGTASGFPATFSIGNSDAAGMSIVKENGYWVYDQDAKTGGDSSDPGWLADNTYDRTAGGYTGRGYTFSCWFKWSKGLGYQNAENIYGGGFKNRTSFVLTPSGYKPASGCLFYRNDGSSSNRWYTWEEEPDLHGNDIWLHMAFTNTGIDASEDAIWYRNGISIQSNLANHSGYDSPIGENQFVWGGWSNTYGNFTGRSNLFMYWERALSDNEILQVYNIQKRRFQ